ncbi:putative cytochrome P450 hydroxylase [Pseudonocardia sp. Ae263_Ps1]|nr:putative cytochrome P450 hydroxylase [Pseudonocardia sp. Ae150A_Ps1]OLL86245.1 putative cytochrome P450 hydroxylase [Pseudonocardia sp. Ae263_Ps1]OLL93724.1 putative cytochrome P450 hydroxylase [Pseudonocardia sp. Ae356_Ps1]
MTEVRHTDAGPSSPLRGRPADDVADPAFWALPEQERADAFARLRAAGGPRFVPGHGRDEGFYAVVRHADVMTASTSPQLFASEPSVTTPPPPAWVRAVFGDSMVNLDGDRHTELRRIVQRAFTPPAGRAHRGVDLPGGPDRRRRRAGPRLRGRRVHDRGSGPHPRDLRDDGDPAGTPRVGPHAGRRLHRAHRRRGRRAQAAAGPRPQPRRPGAAAPAGAPDRAGPSRPARR